VEKICEKIEATELIQTMKDMYQSSGESDCGSDFSTFSGQYLFAAIQHDHTELVTLLLDDIYDEFLLRKYPDLPLVALEAGNIKLAQVLLCVCVPDDWTKDEFPHTFEANDMEFAYRSAVQCACYWDRPDILQRLVIYCKTLHRYEQY